MKIMALFAVIISVILYQHDAARIAALQDRSSEQLSEISTAKVKENSLAGLQSRHPIFEHLEDFEKHKKKTADNKLKNYHPVAVESTHEEKEPNVREDNLKSTKNKITERKKFQPGENVLDNKNNSRRNERIANFRQLDQTYFTKQQIGKENNKFDKVQPNKQSSLVRVKRHRNVLKSQLRSRMFQSSQSPRVNSRKNGYYQANRHSALSKSRAERNRQLQKVYNSVKRRHGTGPRNYD